MEKKQANARSYLHSVSPIACVSIFRNQETQKRATFQTGIRWSAVWLSGQHTAYQVVWSLRAPHPSPCFTVKETSPPKKTFVPTYVWLRNPLTIQKTQKMRRSFVRVRTKSIISYTSSLRLVPNRSYIFSWERSSCFPWREKTCFAHSICACVTAMRKRCSVHCKTCSRHMCISRMCYAILIHARGPPASPITNKTCDLEQVLNRSLLPLRKNRARRTCELALRFHAAYYVSFSSSRSTKPKQKERLLEI